MKRKLKKEVKENLLILAGGIMVAMVLIATIYVGNYRHDILTKKSTAEVPVHTVQDINNHS